MAKILVFSQDVIGKSMAGPGIRSWEFAGALSRSHAVTLAAPNQPDVESDSFAIVSYEKRRVIELLRGYDIIITQSVSPAIAYMARKYHSKVILDAYDPLLLETLEVFRRQPAAYQNHKNQHYWTEMSLSLQFADAVICASQRQRDLWIGALMALNRIRPSDYASDVTLRNLVDVVPFGLRAEDPVPQPGVGFRQKYGIKASDTVLLWAGGIYDWYDPLTLIRAMEIISKQRQDIKLVFLGLKHPNTGVEESSLTGRTKRLSDKLGLTDATVMFNFGWIPYDQWPSYLLETDIGLSCHPDHLETRFAFRTRVIDSYLWGLRPIITTEGDAMADLVQLEGLGRVVKYQDPEGLAKAIIQLADDPTEYAAIQQRLRRLREAYRWPTVVEPVSRLATRLAARPPRRRTWQETKLVFKIYGYILHDLRQDYGWWKVIKNISSKLYRLALRKV